MRAAVVLTGFTLLTFAHGAPSQADFSYRAAVEDCKTVTADLVRPDSGLAGDWAVDTFHRTVKVCHQEVLTEKSAVEVQSWTYTAVGDDEGTFTTKGMKSFKGAPMKPDVTGKMGGHFELTFEAPKDWGLWTGAPANGSKYSTSEWLAHLFSDGFKPGHFTWGWNYSLCNESLVNASTGNHGDITGLSKLPCYQVSFVDKCDGTTVVTLGNQAPASGSIAYYVIEKKIYPVAGGSSPTLVTVTPIDGYVVVTARGHLPWRHKYVKPTCATPTPSQSVPVDNGQPSLPVTGPAVPGAIIGGLALIGLGAAVLIALRKRRTRFTA
jgi:hypothetical protein